MPIDWQGNHPFDESCIEKDMVAKVFGWASDLCHDPALKAWQELLAAVGVCPEAPDWTCVRIKFFAYPGHFGGGKKHGEIGDIVLLGPRLYVVIEAKRPRCAMDGAIEDKIKAAKTLATENKYGEKWPDPVFAMLGTEEARYGDYRLLKWQEVARVFRNLLGADNAISQFIDTQLGDPPQGPRAEPLGKPEALVRVDELLTRLGFDDSCKFLWKPGAHWTCRRTRSNAARMVAIPLGDDFVQLRFKEVPERWLNQHAVRLMDDFYANCFGEHKYAVDLPGDWPGDTETSALVSDCLRHAWR
jgi:hypothetical protein